MRVKDVYMPDGYSTVIFTVVGSPWGLLACWLAIINVVAFFAFGLDKWKAKRKEKKRSVRRVPEKNLLLLAAAGGSVGALLGMRVFRHKTLHRAFRIGVPVILAVQIILALGLRLFLRLH